jgi:molybdopterin-biosynthesis enzyme MoeA-like protein
MIPEIVTTGAELLLGDTVDTNSAYIVRQLRDVGVNLYVKTSVGDTTSPWPHRTRRRLSAIHSVGMGDYHAAGWCCGHSTCCACSRAGRF